MLIHVRYKGICSIHDSGKRKSWLRVLYMFYIMYCIDVLSPFLSMSIRVAGTVYAIS